MSVTPAMRDQVIALAAVVEAARLVDLLARTGSAPAAELKALTESLFRFEWQSVAEVFGGIASLQPALATLEEMLRNFSSPAHGAILRYTIALLRLGRQLSRDRERLAAIRARLAHIGLESERLTTRDEELSTRIAAIYQDTISTYRYRIQVSGSAAHLQTERVAERIRTLLLAGLRAAVLWRFIGGSRTATVLGRSRLLAACRELRATG
ncbi:MAG: high frequency lysogenization protein HflD [Gammaproteobacteria bacterium]|jgi:high frequency lysogenization protein|nr:high frequency lysogenization protein HflD [Gammaproteobacteria bacterium]MBP6050606.1 high frequency lysogenization protein HflD [Pseudomonadales bacterium]MBK6583453.1 high frequency lysogenization protein HflD [Gammaproteobacteria bacterium]MBK7168930.1 high frequency lysogenization protein HflD [Gammaproteobacteria bacterium]MBK7521083.1 high frequency lysogenization protein HflD [Gammaproteobacteria bacterium]